MSDKLSNLEALLRDQPAKPPLHLWNPELSGEMDMLIKSDGSWWYQGGEIAREALVRLFASILRREDDGHYYLLTPVEKWRIQVEDKPLLAIDMEVIDDGNNQQLVFTTNVGTRYCMSPQYPLQFDTDAAEPRPSIVIDNGLSALLTRAVYYRLAELAEQQDGRYFVLSAGERFALQ